MASRIISSVKQLTRPGFLLASYQRFRQDEFATRPSPGSSDISVPRLRQVVDLIRADSGVGPFVEAVTPETLSTLLRQKLGILSSRAEDPCPTHLSFSPTIPIPSIPAPLLTPSFPDAGGQS